MNCAKLSHFEHLVHTIFLVYLSPTKTNEVETAYELLQKAMANRDSVDEQLEKEIRSFIHLEPVDSKSGEHNTDEENVKDHDDNDPSQYKTIKERSPFTSLVARIRTEIEAKLAKSLGKMLRFKTWFSHILYQYC